jgi:hypothetical protein
MLLRDCDLLLHKPIRKDSVSISHVHVTAIRSYSHHNNITSMIGTPKTMQRLIQLESAMSFEENREAVSMMTFMNNDRAVMYVGL